MKNIEFFNYLLLNQFWYGFILVLFLINENKVKIPIVVWLGVITMFSICTIVWFIYFMSGSK